MARKVQLTFDHRDTVLSTILSVARDDASFTKEALVTILGIVLRATTAMYQDALDIHDGSGFSYTIEYPRHDPAAHIIGTGLLAVQYSGYQYDTQVVTLDDQQFISC